MLKHCTGSASWLPNFVSLRWAYRLGRRPGTTALSASLTTPSSQLHRIIDGLLQAETAVTLEKNMKKNHAL